MTLLEDKNRPYQRLRPNPSEKIQLADAGLQWVLSSNVSAIGVNDDDLIIRFHNGSLYMYPNRAYLYRPMLQSNSKGHFVWVKLRRTRVEYRKIGTLPLKSDKPIDDDAILDLIDNQGMELEARLKQLGVFIAPDMTKELLGLFRPF